MHAAKLARSPRLARLLAYLRTKGPAGATTREIQMAVGACAVNSDAAELRANGYAVACKQEASIVNARGERRRIYRYRLVGKRRAA